MYDDHSLGGILPLVSSGKETAQSRTLECLTPFLCDMEPRCERSGNDQIHPGNAEAGMCSAERRRLGRIGLPTSIPRDRKWADQWCTARSMVLSINGVVVTMVFLNNGFVEANKHLNSSAFQGQERF
jgi:hypothetical protein